MRPIESSISAISPSSADSASRYCSAVGDHVMVGVIGGAPPLGDHLTHVLGGLLVRVEEGVGQHDRGGVDAAPVVTRRRERVMGIRVGDEQQEGLVARGILLQPLQRLLGDVRRRVQLDGDSGVEDLIPAGHRRRLGQRTHKVRVEAMLASPVRPVS